MLILTDQQHHHSQNESESPSHTHRKGMGSLDGQRLASHIFPPPRLMDKKPALACLPCRKLKIRCNPPVSGSKDRTCNQCTHRHSKCEYPLQPRRGMKKKRRLPVPFESGSLELKPGSSKDVESG